MKKHNTLILKLVLIFLIILFFESCKKDPIQESKSDFFEKLKGTWFLSDYNLKEYGYASNAAQKRRTWFLNNIITDTIINCQYPTCDTTINTCSYYKQLYFIKYEKETLYYGELTLISGATITIDNSVKWTNLTIDNLILNIDNFNYKFILDSLNNLVLEYKDDSYSPGIGHHNSKKYVFRKL